MGKYCQKCGTSLEDAALFCCSCGAQLSIPNPPVDPTTHQDNTPTTSIGQDSAKISPASTKQNRKKTLLICGTVLMIAVAVVIFALAGTSANREPPFFGIEIGDSVEAVEKRMGVPDDFEDNGMRNFNYYYEVEFLNIDGYIQIHFELDKVDTLYFHYYSASTAIEYEDVIKYYTKKYGEPDETGDNYYSSGEYAFWLLDNNTGLRVQHTPSDRFSKAHLEIAVYS